MLETSTPHVKTSARVCLMPVLGKHNKDDTLTQRVDSHDVDPILDDTDTLC